jgi:hypothetical protein
LKATSSAKGLFAELRIMDMALQSCKKKQKSAGPADGLLAHDQLGAQASP